MRASLARPTLFPRSQAWRLHEPRWDLASDGRWRATREVVLRAFDVTSIGASYSPEVRAQLGVADLPARTAVAMTRKRSAAIDASLKQRKGDPAVQAETG